MSGHFDLLIKCAYSTVFVVDDICLTVGNIYVYTKLNKTVRLLVTRRTYRTQGTTVEHLQEHPDFRTKTDCWEWTIHGHCRQWPANVLSSTRFLVRYEIFYSITFDSPSGRDRVNPPPIRNVTFATINTDRQVIRPLNPRMRKRIDEINVCSFVFENFTEQNIRRLFPNSH